MQRLPARWGRQQIADRFLWLEGPVGVAEAHSPGEAHGYLAFQTHRQTVAGWWGLAVGGWQLAVVGGWRLAAVGSWWSLGAVLEGRP